MRKIVAFIVVTLISISAFAQQEVTKFLGIPIDGDKNSMIKKIEAKGFIYDQREECLKGEFNGRSVSIHVVTNRNKVYRICVFDENWLNETDIKIRFNRLCSQFENNEKYIKPLMADDYRLDEDFDISYEISVNNKRIEASYYQCGTNEEFIEEVSSVVKSMPKQEPDTVDTSIVSSILVELHKKFSNRTVWFMIDEKYGKYRILMFYDNVLNQSNGDDL